MLSKGKKYLKNIIVALLNKDYLEYIRIWIILNVKTPCMSIDNSFWDRPIFVHIPKTAGTSINEMNVSSIMGHKSIQFYQKRLPKGKEFPFSFTVVRNPYSRLCSSYYYLKRNGNSGYDKIWAKFNLSKYHDVNDFIMNGLKKKHICRGLHFIPQTNFITDKNGNIGVSKVIRFENLNNEWNELSKKVNVGSELPEKNTSGGGTRKHELTEKSRNIIYNFYREDFINFGYDK